jgi:four helix bundle protein
MCSATQFFQCEDLMAKIKSFRELDVWNCAMSLVLICYQLSDSFPKSEQYGLTSQLRRAAASVPANIAEGHNRRSQRAYLNHVNIALGSQAELDTLLELAQRLKYLSPVEMRRVRLDLDRTGQMLHGLSRSLERKLFAEAAEENASAGPRPPSAGGKASLHVVHNSLY